MQHLPEARARVLLIISFALLSLLIIPPTTHPVEAQTQNQNLLYISPAQQANKTNGMTIKYQVKVANMDPFNTWDMQVTTDPKVLNPTDLTTSPNTLTANYSINLIELTKCINGVGPGCDPQKGDGLGVVHSAVFPLGSNPPVSSVSGVLFTITYTVVNGTGLAGVSIFNDKIASDNLSLVSHVTKNGIYGNAKLPVVDFYWTPIRPSLGQNVIFTSNSSDPNPGGSITAYSWNLGDGNRPDRPTTQNTTDIYTVQSGGTPLNSTCGSALKFTIQLTVTDKLGIQNSQTHEMLTKAIGTDDLAVSTITVTPADAVYAGTIATIDAFIANQGTLDEGSFNVSISVEHRPIANATFDSKIAGSPLTCKHKKPFEFRWNTAGLAPGSYEIEAYVSPVRNATSHQLLETDLQNDLFVHVVQIIAPMGSSLIPFTLPESVGLVGVLVVGIVVARLAISRERSKRGDLSEELA